MLGDEHKKTLLLLVVMFGVILLAGFVQTDTWKELTGTQIGGPAEINREYESAEWVLEEEKDYVATIVTDRGEILVDLLETVAPSTTNNFVFLAENDFYDGLTFHRMIKDFMIQGGDPAGDGSGGPGYTFEDEISDTVIRAGTVAMANAGANTNGSQFFIVTEKEQPNLQGKYSVFGTVQEGMEVVLEIASVEVVEDRYGEISMPVEAVMIDDVIITTK